MKRIITAALSALLAIGGLTAIASPASAHTPGFSASCNGISLNAASYDACEVNTWTVTIGGATQSGTFGASFSQTFPVPQSGATTSWSATVRDPAGDYAGTDSGSVGPCGESPAVHTTPASPTVTPPTCTSDGSLVVPPNTSQVTYSGGANGAGPGTYTIHASPVGDVVLDGTTSWPVTVEPKKTGSECDTSVTPVAPAVKANTLCDTYGSITFAETAGIIYALEEGDGLEGTYRVVATAKPGYVIADGAQTVFTGDLLGKFTCDSTPPVTPVAPAVRSNTICDAPGSITFDETVKGIAYTRTEGDGVEGPYRVVATAKPGYVIADGTQTVFIGDLLYEISCDSTPPVTPPTTPTPPTPPTPPTTTTVVHHLTPPAMTTVTQTTRLPNTGAPTGIFLLLLLGTACVLGGTATVAFGGRRNGTE